MSEERERNVIVLSRFFDANVLLVAGVCSRCYTEAEDDDVKIVAVNRRFVRKRTVKISKSPLWRPPPSPHNLIEESLFHDPWSLLVATIFLNKTSCRNARPRVEEFLRDFPGPLEVLQKEPAHLEKYFLDLGLQRRRAEQVWRMSGDYARKCWSSPRELYGIGKYGDDAYRIFVLGDLDVEPEDRFLRIYRDWARMTTGSGRCTAHRIQTTQ